MENLYDLIKNVIENLSDGNLLDLHREFCEENNYVDDYVYYMNDFDELESGRSPLEIAQLVVGEDFNPNHEYYKYTIYGVKSSDYVSDLIDISDLTDWVFEDTNRIIDYLCPSEEEELDELLGLSDDEEEDDEDEE